MSAVSDDDRRHMRRALALAARAHGRTAPNPMVGCVLVKGGHVVGEGYHHKAGLPHAEVEALRDAGRRAKGATAYVSLEPCNHHGRTGPCTEALMAAGVARVVAAMGDPNPRVDGGGAERLRAAGIPTEIGLLEGEARALNAGFLKWAATGRPLVILKAAVSLDGSIAARSATVGSPTASSPPSAGAVGASGDARWITGEAARREAHRLRDRCDAVLVGAGTVRADDPALTTRMVRGRDPLRVILDGRLSTPPRAKVVVPGTLVVASNTAPEAAERWLVARGAEVVRLPGHAGHVDPGALLEELGRRGVLELLVEGGASVHGSLIAAGLVDRAVIFVAPVLLGARGVPLLDWPGPPTMAAAPRLHTVAVRRLGDDTMLIVERDPPPDAPPADATLDGAPRRR